MNFFSKVSGKILQNEPLAKHTSLRIGGPADYWIEPKDEEDLKRVLAVAAENRLRIFIFGGGSNILAADKGFAGVVVSLAAESFKRMRKEGGAVAGVETVAAGAGTPNTLFIQFCAENALGGAEFLSGIPGCVGGSVAMNAGSQNQSIDQILDWARVMSYDGQVKTINKNQIPFRYRDAGLKNQIVLEAGFVLKTQTKEAILKKLEEYRQYRAGTQDLFHASAGCMFKNPIAAGCSSGKLIDDAGLKGKTIGGAQVSQKHANFIINLGQASAQDVKNLITDVQKTVKQKFNVELETEVKFLE